MNRRTSITAGVGLTAVAASFAAGYAFGVSSERDRAEREKNKVTVVVSKKIGRFVVSLKSFAVGAVVGALFVSLYTGRRRRRRRPVAIVRQ